MLPRRQKELTKMEKRHLHNVRSTSVGYSSGWIDGGGHDWPVMVNSWPVMVNSGRLFSAILGAFVKLIYLQMLVKGEG